MDKCDCAEDIICIIRSVGERTTCLCSTLLQSFFVVNPIHQVNEIQPFYKALQTSLEIGLESGKTWTLVVDADVLINIYSLKKIITLLPKLPDNAFMFHAAVMDKFFLRERFCGNRFYRTSSIERLLHHLPEFQFTHRPEGSLCRHMQSMGFGLYKSKHIIGLHDYEQSYIDILRKSILFGIKHKLYVPYLRNLWSASRLLDKDYEAALDGLASSPSEINNLTIDKSLLTYCNRDLIDYWQKNEKTELDANTLSQKDIEKLLASEMSMHNIIQNPLSFEVYN